MNRRVQAFAAILACVAILPCRLAVAASLGCDQAAAGVEQRLGLPSGLLRSIGEVETGNRPWSVNADGVGASFVSADDAISFVRRGAGAARCVDVGCFQVDLAYHPTAFRSLEDAFDPVANATAAGEFLVSLRRGASSWSDAVARYHSGQPDRGGPYAARVYASLGTRATEEIEVMAPFAGIRVVVPAGFRTAGAGRHFSGPGLPVVQTP